MIFYFSLASGSQMKTAREKKYPYILINHQTKIADSFRRREHHRSIFVDCGGFSSSLITGGYRTSDKEYLRFVDRVRADVFALRDYPCEPEILRKWGRTVTDHIELTVSHHIKILDICNGIRAKPVPVIQGWKVEDYLYCIDRFKEQGLITDYVAIGSICRRGSQKQIRKIINVIKDELPNVRLHGFGISINALKYKDVWDSLYSADSGAWDYASRWRNLKENMSKREASEVEYSYFLAKLKGLGEKHEKQKCLQEVFE